MNHQRFCDVLCRGLTLCIQEIKTELDNGLVAEPERPSFEKCLAELNQTLAKLRDAQTGRSVIMDQTFWFNLDDALYALEEAPHLVGAAEIERLREAILDWQGGRLVAA
jgi:hypothetical protein